MKHFTRDPYNYFVIVTPDPSGEEYVTTPLARIRCVPLSLHKSDVKYKLDVFLPSVITCRVVPNTNSLPERTQYTHICCYVNVSINVYLWSFFVVKISPIIINILPIDTFHKRQENLVWSNRWQTRCTCIVKPALPRIIIRNHLPQPFYRVVCWNMKHFCLLIDDWTNQRNPPKIVKKKTVVFVFLSTIVA